MNTEQLQTRIEKIQDQLGHLPKLESVESIATSLTMFEAIVKELRTIYMVKAMAQRINMDPPEEEDPQD